MTSSHLTLSHIPNSVLHGKSSDCQEGVSYRDRFLRYLARHMACSYATSKPWVVLTMICCLTHYSADERDVVYFHQFWLVSLPSPLVSFSFMLSRQACKKRQAMAMDSNIRSCNGFLKGRIYKLCKGFRFRSKPQLVIAIAQVDSYITRNQSSLKCTVGGHDV